MDYSRIYNQLITSALVREMEDTRYYEKHHIIPKCMGGDNSPVNLVTLTAREHFVAHLLLTRIYPQNYKLLHAFAMMSVVSGNVQRVLKSRDFERGRQARVRAMRLDPRKDAWREIRSQAMLDNNPMYNTSSRMKMSATRKQKFESGELIPNIPTSKHRLVASIRMSSDVNPMKGHPEKNHTARPHKVIFEDGSEQIFQYGKLGYEKLQIPRSTWILATRTGTGIPKYKIKQIIKM